MQYTVYLIRHGKTEGNLEGRYIGSRTDEPLCEAGRTFSYEKQKALVNRWPELAKADSMGVFVSPMLRCLETGQILFPGLGQQEIDALKEIDFGEFENKNYSELNGSPVYQAWIDSGGTADYPGGETLEHFIRRSMKGFREVLEGMHMEQFQRAVVVCHGGSIMAVMSELFGGNYFDYQVKNLEGYRLIAEMEEGKIVGVSYVRI